MIGMNFWDERYGNEDYFYGTEPNAFLASKRGLLKPGMQALAIADGEGRNGVWLAQQGAQVLSVDGSAVGLAKARKLAASRGVSVATEQVDLATWDFGQARFDLVVSIFAHLEPALRRRVHGAIIAALKPGGLLLLEAYRPKQLEYKTGGPPVAEMMPTAAILREDFAALRIAELVERDAEIHEGKGHGGMSALVDLVAVKAA